MTRKKTIERGAVKRIPGQRLVALMGDPNVTPEVREVQQAQCRRLLDAAKELLHRLEFGEQPPTYLLKAITRFANEESDRILKIAVRNTVVRVAKEENLALTQETKDGSETAFSHVAKKANKSTAWVADAYAYPSGRKAKQKK